MLSSYIWGENIEWILNTHSNMVLNTYWGTADSYWTSIPLLWICYFLLCASPICMFVAATCESLLHTDVLEFIAATRRRTEKKATGTKQWYRRSIGISSISTCAQHHVAVSDQYPFYILDKLRHCSPIAYIILCARRSTLTHFRIGQSGIQVHGRL
jgi:hypothetical protein